MNFKKWKEHQWGVGTLQVVNIHVIVIPKAGERTEKILEEITEKIYYSDENYKPKHITISCWKPGIQKKALKAAAEKKDMSHIQGQG